MHLQSLFELIKTRCAFDEDCAADGRFWFDDDLQLLRPGAEAFVNSLRKYNLALMDKTPDMTTVEIRKNKRFSLGKAKEIKEWLAMHPEVTRYMVLEDLNLHDPVLTALQIKTDPFVGLTNRMMKEQSAF